MDIDTRTRSFTVFHTTVSINSSTCQCDRPITCRVRYHLPYHTQVPQVRYVVLRYDCRVSKIFELFTYEYIQYSGTTDCRSININSTYHSTAYSISSTYHRGSINGPRVLLRTGSNVYFLGISHLCRVPAVELQVLQLLYYYCSKCCVLTIELQSYRAALTPRRGDYCCHYHSMDNIKTVVCKFARTRSPTVRATSTIDATRTVLELYRPVLWVRV